MPTPQTMDRFTARVLRLVAEDSPVGFVRLSTQVWPLQVPTDWWLLLEAVCADLNMAGLVKLRMGVYPHGGEYGWAEIGSKEEILEVRITNSGLLKAGFPMRRADIQKRNSMMVAHDYIKPDPRAIWIDWTRYWHHPFSAIGGPIEREPLPLHRAHYPSHRHGDWTTEGDTVMLIAPTTGKGSKIDPAKVEHARKLLGEGKTYREASAESGVSLFTLYKIVPADNEVRRRAAATREAAKREARVAPTPAYEKEVVLVPAEAVARLSPEAEAQFIAGSIQAESVKNRMLKTIAATGPFKSLDEVIDVIRQPSDKFDVHEAYHFLNSLNQAGLVRYVHRAGSRRKTSGKPSATNIRATAAGYRAAGFTTAMDFTPKGGAHPRVRGNDGTEARNQPTVAPGGPIEHIKVLDIHEHDTEVWLAKCQACMVYHPTGQTHNAAERSRTFQEQPVETTVVRAANGTAIEVDVPAGVDIVAVRDHEPPVLNIGDYPVLKALREREEARLAASKRSAKYLEAAALLEEVDLGESQRILALAQEAEGDPFTNAEREYLTFAKNHGA